MPNLRPEPEAFTQPPVAVTGRVDLSRVLTGRPNSPDERRNLMQTTTLARYGAPIAIVAGALMIITRLVILFTTQAEIGPLKAYVLTTTHAVNSVVSILAFALLVIALVALYEGEARSAGAFGALAFGGAVIGTMFMTGDWWTRPLRCRAWRRSHPTSSTRSSGAG